MKLAEIRDEEVIREYLNNFGEQFVYIGNGNWADIDVEVSPQFYEWLYTTPYHHTPFSPPISIMRFVTANNLITTVGGTVNWKIRR